MGVSEEIRQKDQYFHFKEFSVRHDRSSMKVGTDAVLLGLLASCPEQGKILEVGSGCGVISLIIAERSQGEIIAIDPDEQSILDTKENFSSSKWNDRLECKQKTFQHFAKESTQPFNFIFSNPPYFSKSLKGPNEIRNRARHTDTLPFDQFASCTSKLLVPGGIVSVILPSDQKASFVSEMNKVGLGLIKSIDIIPIEGRTPVRVIVEFSYDNPKIDYQQLTLRNQYGEITEEYKKLGSEWYLNMR